jgi:hypothetical protein
VIFGFPSSDEVAILAIGQHDDRKGRDAYVDLYGALGLSAPPKGPRTKPPCCDGQGEAEVDISFFDEIRGALKPEGRGS